MRTLRFTIAVLLLAALALFAGPIAAQEGELPSPPVGLVNLLGAQGGAFDEYAASWDASEEVRIVMSYAPAGFLVDNQVGFNVWGPEGLIAMGEYEGIQGEKGATFDADADVVYQIQVFNYGIDLGLAYTLTITPELRPEVIAPVVEEADEPEVAIEPDALPTATMFLTGTRTGAFHEFDVSWDTSETVTLTIEYMPAGALIDVGFGFNIWGPEGRVATSAFTETHGSQEATFDVEANTIYQVQVYNYLDESIAYRLIVTID